MQELEIDKYVGFVFELLDGLRIDTASVIGNSLGGWIAMRMAIQRQNSIMALVLEDSAGVSNPREMGTLNELDSIRTPTLIAWGSEDKVLPIEAAKYLHSHIKNSELEVFEGAGHVPHWERPEDFNSRVSRFLDEVSRDI